MRTKKSIAFCIWLFACMPSLAAAIEYRSTTVSSDGQLMLQAADGRAYPAPKVRGQLVGAENQVSFSKPLIAPDQRTVGWLAQFPNCCTSYPIPLELVLLRDGKVIQRITGAGLPIWGWKFMAGSKQVAITQRPTHGAAPDHYELRDVASGKLLDQYDHEEGKPEESIPEWAQGLN